MRLPRPIVVGLLIVGPAILRALQRWPSDSASGVVWNLVPIGALALFCGSHFRSRSLALAIPIASMLLGDVLLAIATRDPAKFLFYRTMPLVYVCYLVNGTMGMGLRAFWKWLDRARGVARPDFGELSRADGLGRAWPTPLGDSGPATRPLLTHIFPIAGATLAGSVLFFIVTNFAVWWQYDDYARSWSGLINCYLAGVPFFRGTFVGDAVGSLVLFGGQYLLDPERASMPDSERF